MIPSSQLKKRNKGTDSLVKSLGRKGVNLITGDTSLCLQVLKNAVIFTVEIENI